MTEVVDSIVAELIARDNGYTATFNKAIAVHKELLATAGALARGEQQYAAQHGKSAGDTARAETQAAVQINRAKKSVADAAAASAKAITDAQKAEQRALEASERASAKATAAAQKEAEKKAAAARAAADAVVAAAAKEEAAQARVAAMVERSLARQASSNAKGTGALFGSSVPRQTTMIPNSVVPAATVDVAEIAAEKEINHALADRFDALQRQKVLTGQLKQDAADEAAWLLRINTYQRAGLSDAEATERATRETALIEQARAEKAATTSLVSAKQFAQGATLGRFGGSGAAIAGIATTAAIYGGATLIGNAASYGKELQQTAKDLGLTTEELQTYQFAAKQAGATNEQLATSFAQFQDGLGKAKTGSADFLKAFQALGVGSADLKKFTDAGSALPSIIDRLSSIHDPAVRASVGYKLFGEQYRLLDPILSGGNQHIADLTKHLASIGGILSDQQVDKLGEASKTLSDLQDKLKIDVAGVVADNAKSIESLATALSKLTGEVIGFLNAHPEAALSVIGGLLGGAAGGLPGVAVGAVAGYGAGSALSHASADSKMDVKFRQQQLANAQHELDARKRLAAGQTPSGATSILGGLFVVRHQTDDGSGATVKSAQAEVDRQQGLLANAQTAAKTTPPRVVANGKVDPTLLALLNAGKGKSAEQLRKEAEERTQRYNDQLARFQDQILDAQQAQAVGDAEQVRLKAQQITADHDRTAADIKSAVSLHKLNDGDAKLLLDKNDELQKQRLAVLALQTRVDLYNRANGIAEQDLQAQSDMLKSEAGLATTTADRRSLLLKALAADEKAYEKSQTDIINSPDPNVSDTDRALASDRLGNYQRGHQQRVDEITKSNRPPLESYLASLPNTPKELNEAFENVAVDGLQHLTDGLTAAITGTESLGKAFSDVSKTIIADLVKIGIQREIIGPLANLLFPTPAAAAGVPAAGGIFSAIAKLVSGTGTRAAGGPVVAGVPYIVGEHRPEVFIPSVSGRIAPDVTANGGARTLVQNIHVDGRNSVTPADFAQQIIATSAAHAEQVGFYAIHAGAIKGKLDTLTAAARPSLPRGN